MKKSIIYTYLGENGTLTSSIYLPGIYSIKKYELSADVDKQLTKDNKNFFSRVIVTESDLKNWYEVTK
jgi:hypothetical protein